MGLFLEDGLGLLRLETFGLGESYWTLRLRDTIDFYSNSKGRILTNSLHRDLLTLYSIVLTVQGYLLPIVYVIHDLINEHNSECRHHSLSRTTLKERA